MPDRPDVSNIVRRITSTGGGTGPIRRNNIPRTDKQQTRARRMASVFRGVTLFFGTTGLIVFAVSLCLARIELLFLAVALFALPWARVGFRTIRGDD